MMKINFYLSTLSTVLKQKLCDKGDSCSEKIQYTSLGHSSSCLISSRKITGQNKVSLWKTPEFSRWPNIKNDSFSSYIKLGVSQHMRQIYLNCNLNMDFQYLYIIAYYTWFRIFFLACSMFPYGNKP